MNDTVRSMWWSDQPRDQPDDAVWTVIGEDDFQETENRVTGRDRLPGRVPQWADDLFRVARAVFTTDKRVRRTSAADRWTRRVRVSVPVEDPGLWRSPVVRHHLGVLLQTLTADVWAVDFRPLTGHHVAEALPLTDADRAGEVALFSGGLDSLGWAATRARAHDPRPLLLVMFREVSLRRLQRGVYQAVRMLSTVRDVQLLELGQTPAGDGTGQRLETSSRTRGLLYAAGAVRAAAAHGVTTVHVPENGQVALNPPLTAARSAACSTRSVHPFTLHHLNSLIALVSAEASGVRVVNPLAHLTKGGVCRLACSAGLSPQDLAATLSCGKSPVRQGRRSRSANCGVCFPCLVRRSGLLQTEGGDLTPYETSPWHSALSPHRSRDWNALQLWLHTPYTLDDLLADTPLPRDTDPAAALDVIRRGREELAQLLRPSGATAA